jgi:hypothetical protein
MGSLEGRVVVLTSTLVKGVHHPSPHKPERSRQLVDPSFCVSL